MYRIDFKPAAVRQLRRLARQITLSDWERLEEAIDDLGASPRPSGALKLSGTEFYRIRVGGYRVIYVVDDKESTVTITKVARRSEATYR